MTVHNPMPFELKVSNVVSDVYRLFDVFFSLSFICMLVDAESGNFLFCNILVSFISEFTL